MSRLSTRNKLHKRIYNHKARRRRNKTLVAQGYRLFAQIETTMRKGSCYIHRCYIKYPDVYACA